MRAIILAALASVIFTGVALAVEPAEEPAADPRWTDRIYPYAGVEQRWSFQPDTPDRSDLVWSVGAAYSLGAFSPGVAWRWNPEPGTDVNELVISVRLKLRGLFD